MPSSNTVIGLLQQQQYYCSRSTPSFQKILGFTRKSIVQQQQQRRICHPTLFVELNKSFPSLVIQPYQYLIVLDKQQQQQQQQQQQYRNFSSSKTEDPSSLPSSSSSSSQSTNNVNEQPSNIDVDDDDDDDDDDEENGDKEEEYDEGDDDDDYEERVSNFSNNTTTTPTPNAATTTLVNTNFTSRYKRKNKTSNKLKSNITDNINIDQYTKEVPICMPDLGTGNNNFVLKWYKQEGDIVQYGDKLCDIQTQDFTFGIEIEDDEIGFVGEIIVPAPSEPISPDEVLCILLHHESSSSTSSFTE